MKDTIRFGIIGLGNIGKVHAGHLLANRVGNGRLTAVCVRSSPSIKLPDDTRVFDNLEAMLGSGSVDAVIVATPHPLHPDQGIRVLKAGLHLLMEKPLAATKLDCERLLAVPRRPGQLFGVMLNLRTHPQLLRVRDLLDKGGLGAVQRMHWTITKGLRTEAYFAMSEWRGTWKGEGGGVLINQALHQLDIVQWLFGPPVRVRAHCRFGAEHDIEVEDSVVAEMEFANGAVGTFITSTGETPGVYRLEVSGTGGLIVLEDDILRVRLNTVDAREYSRTAGEAFGSPETCDTIYPGGGENPSHLGVLRNFVGAALGREALCTDAAEGLPSVELANAMVYSTWKDEAVALPVDSAAYQAALARVIATTPPRVRTIRKAVVDMSKSYL